MVPGSPQHHDTPRARRLKRLPVAWVLPGIRLAGTSPMSDRYACPHRGLALVAVLLALIGQVATPWSHHAVAILDGGAPNGLVDPLEEDEPDRLIGSLLPLTRLTATSGLIGSMARPTHLASPTPPVPPPRPGPTVMTVIRQR